ncbi:TRAP transporter large permease [Petroclostridium sp. X23]|uniref:TRAP transporter large permease n=1 Tax=Petroclostridium sp. X23 TaxID=3045146 RepID=UPI0024ACAEA3|nr:TRAP transporter large permease [Petroclostridium sp. X23]WHH57140.1 TRAP transporter large permease [Petroclostridium sp. X23]
MLILLGTLFVLLAIGMPVAFSIVIGTLAYILFVGENFPIVVLAQRMVTGTDSYVLLSIPLFMFAGELLNTGGLTKRLVTFSQSIIGSIRGGLSYVVIIVNMIMAGVSGAAIADAAAVGSVMIPSMVKSGYSKNFACAVNASAATMGPVIPPSVSFIVYGTLANVSIGKLFLAGAVPGVLMGIYMMAVCYIVAVRKNLPRGEKTSIKRFITSTKEASFALMMPVIILGGIMTGIVTPTEAAVIAVAYGLMIGLFVYKEIKWSNIPYMLAKAAKESAVIMFIIACAQAFGWVLAREGVPAMLVEIFSSISSQSWVFLIIINIVVLILGCFMEGTSILIILTPLLIPVLQNYGIDLLQFGVVITLNIMIGLLTPPVGLLLYVITGIGNVSMKDVVKDLFPFLVALFLVLAMITYIPQITLFLPSIFS